MAANLAKQMWVWYYKPVNFDLTAPSSSGPGQLVLSQKIAGSTPAGVTNLKLTELKLFMVA